jgi:thiamine-monophosphate kinase
MAKGEFDLIEQFLPLTRGERGTFGLANDAAILSVREGYDLVASADMLVADVHFRNDDPPGAIAHKALAVNLSDLAAMGARPLGYLLTIAWPSLPEDSWLTEFINGFKKLQEHTDIYLLGGDTVSTKDTHLSLSVTVLGEVSKGRALERGSAREGDLIFLSGTLGDAGLGLDVLNGTVPTIDAESQEFLVERYRRPSPRVALGQVLANEGLASACLDVSDGLLADAGHIAVGSGLKAVIHWESLPLSGAAQCILDQAPDLWPRVAAGGDDYELLFTVSPDLESSIAKLSGRLGLQLTQIGRMQQGSGVALLDRNGVELSAQVGGWRHF